MEKVEIIPCPFCGGEGELQYRGIWFNADEVPRTSFVQCRKCGAVGERFEISRKYSSDEKAIEAWNRRANNEEGNKNES